VNEALMKLRKRRGASWVSLDEPVEGDDESFMPREVEDWHDNPEQQYAKDELQRILASAIESLELPYRTVFLLRDAEGLSTEETAEALGISVPAVKSRLLRARLKLRERLNRHFRKG
jgi:RNA polymerase sigma-70 factor (ECF subfamily)